MEGDKILKAAQQNVGEQRFGARLSFFSSDGEQDDLKIGVAVLALFKVEGARAVWAKLLICGVLEEGEGSYMEKLESGLEQYLYCSW